MLRGAMGGQMPIDEYVERPRPSLYNVIKKLKEAQNVGQIVNRFCYIAKVNEHEFKGDLDKLEKEFTKWTEGLLHQEEEVPAEHPDIDFREGNHEGMYQPQVFTGFAAIVYGGFMIHMLECENPLMTKFITALHTRSKEKGSYYKNIWVINYQEDVAYRAYLNWSCKRIGDQTETTVANMNSFERQAYIYESMVKVGEKSAEGKDPK